MNSNEKEDEVEIGELESPLVETIAQGDDMLDDFRGRGSVMEDNGNCCTKCFTNPLNMLYISQAFTSFGDRMWAFAIGFFLGHLSGFHSFFTIGMLGFARCIVVFLFGPLVGVWVDMTGRWRAVIVAIVSQNLLVAICCLVLTLSLYSLGKDNAQYRTLCEVIVVTLAVLAALPSLGSKLCVTKDWMPVLCRGDALKMSKANVLLRRIDLSMMALAPAAIGFIMDTKNPDHIIRGALFAGAWNVVSMVLELSLLRHVYYLHPALASKKKLNHSVSRKEALLKPIRSICTGWVEYARQTTVLPGIASALLYFTVISFEEPSIVYLASQGMTSNQIGTVKTIAAVVGILATFSYSQFRKRFSADGIGCCAFISHVLILSVAGISVFVRGSPFEVVSVLTNTTMGNTSAISAGGNITDADGSIFDCQESYDVLSSDCKVHLGHILPLLISMTLSRITLWTADFAVSEMLIDRVIEMKRGVVNGVQNSANDLVTGLIFFVLMLLPHPRQFGYLILATVIAMTLAAILYTFYYCSYGNTHRRRLPPSNSVYKPTTSECIAPNYFDESHADDDVIYKRTST